MRAQDDVGSVGSNEGDLEANAGRRGRSALREEIISGDLAPGATVVEIPTAERLGVSRVPVRERCWFWNAMDCWCSTNGADVASAR